MTHVRRQIREAVAGRLLDAGGATDPATWANRVYQGKRWRWQAEQLPGVAVYTDAAAIRLEDMDMLQRRDIAVVLELAAATPAGTAAGESEPALEDVLDTMCLEAERAFDPDERFDGLAFEWRLDREETEASVQGDVMVAIRRQWWTAVVMTMSGDPAEVASAP